MYPLINNTPKPKQVDSIYLNRLNQFLDQGQYRDLNLPQWYETKRTDNLEILVYEVEGTQRPLLKDLLKSKDFKFEKQVHKGDSFGPSWKTFWFKIGISVPKDWPIDQEIWFQWDCGNEGLIYTLEGEPLQALTGNGDRPDFILPKSWVKQEPAKHYFYLEMSCNGMFGTGSPTDISPPDPNRYFRLNTADLILPNLTARALRFDYWIISDAARELPDGSWQKYKAREIATRIIDTFDPQDEKSLGKCRAIAKEFLGENIDSEQVYIDGKGNNEIKVYGVGNCHIDTAWLWPFAETRRKVLRSWTTQLNLLKRYPEYQFVASQAQQFKWLKQDHPDVFESLKPFISQNQFIPIGGSWVENDTNIPSGESLVRQFLFGQRFFKSNFGIYSKTFWLPDTFGYSSQIPQICRLAGFTSFLTQKLSWNNINSFPNTTFNWVALDGTQILTHMPPANTYTADANFGDVVRSISQHKNLSYDQTSLLLFGKGDGGGGPTYEMMEKLRRCRGLANTVGLIPKVHLGYNVEDFFDNLMKNSHNGQDLVSWVGELYFEFHRGTYTTQALVKKYMRSAEIKLHDLEYFATILSILLPKDEYEYPLKEINEIWEDVLLCQFHDVLPGSCIEMVYKDEVRPMLTKAIEKAEKLIEVALNKISTKKGNDITLKSLQWELPARGKSGGSKVKYPANITKNDEDKSLVLSNGKYQVTLQDGVIKSLYDLVNEFEVIDIKTGANRTGGNQFVLLKDTPLNWQAWDTEVYSLDKIEYLSGAKMEISLETDEKCTVLIKQKISDKSWIESKVSIFGLNSLEEDSLIEIDNKVSWEESRKFLKVEFPVNIHSDFASYETQFGITKRPTHYNTNWDVAKFEVCHHKFADYSDFSYGVSILNDCKYGFSTHGNIMRLSLLRSPKEPDPNADIGVHHFKYAIYPHKGALSSKTVKMGYQFNYPAYKVGGSGGAGVKLASKVNDFIKISSMNDNLVLSNIKRAEDDDEFASSASQSSSEESSVIVRVYESLGGSAKGLLEFGKEFKKVEKVDLLERDITDKNTKLKTVANNKIEITSRPFEIQSFKIYF